MPRPTEIPSDMSVAIPTVAILAGGRGSRLGDLTHARPKALMVLEGEPFIYHQLRELEAQGVAHVVLCVGYLGEMIANEVGNSFNSIEIEYSFDSPSLAGTLGALRNALPLLGSSFLVLYGDTLLTLDYGDVVRRWRSSGRSAAMTVLRVDGRTNVGNATVEGDLVVRYDKFERHRDMYWIDYGLLGFSAPDISSSTSSDLAVLLAQLAKAGSLMAYEAKEVFREIGTPERLRATQAFLLSRREQNRATSG